MELLHNEDLNIQNMQLGLFYMKKFNSWTQVEMSLCRRSRVQIFQ